MHRTWMRRVGALWLALWMSVWLAEQAVPRHCLLHAAMAAEMDGMGPMASMVPAVPASHAHAGALSEPQDPTGGPHPCCCLEQCCCGTPVLLMQRAAIAAPAPTAPAGARPPRAAPRVALSLPDTRLPFANGPPHAFAA